MKIKYHALVIPALIIKIGYAQQTYYVSPNGLPAPARLPHSDPYGTSRGFTSIGFKNNYGWRSGITRIYR